MIESPALSLDIDDHEDLVLLCERLSPNAALNTDPELTAWLNRHFSRISAPFGVIENADCA